MKEIDAIAKTQEESTVKKRDTVWKRIADLWKKDSVEQTVERLLPTEEKSWFSPDSNPVEEQIAELKKQLEKHNVPGYEDLERILRLAYEQAAIGKGKERHGVKGERWSRQPIIRHQIAFGPGFALGQAAKKMEEAQYLEPEAAKFELLGAIVYIAAAYRFFEVKDDAVYNG